MDAVISGRAGRALLLERDSLKSFDVDDPSKLVPRRQSDLPYLFGETQDLRAIENTDIESVRQELKHDCQWNWALDLALISLDAELPDDIRQEAIEGLDELLADNRVTERLERILYARPLPEDGDIREAFHAHMDLLVGVRVFALNARALLERFQRRQPLIWEVSAAWDIIPIKIFGGYERQAEFQHVAIREGLFRAFIFGCETQDTLVPFDFEVELNDSIKQLHNYEEVLSHWVSLIIDRRASEVARERAAAVAELGHIGDEDSFREICAAFDDPVVEVRDAAARSLFNLNADRNATFTRALRESSPARRRKIGAALASSGLASEAIGQLAGESREKTYEAFSLLFLMSKAGEVQPLLRAIEEHPNNEVRLAVVKLLALSGQQEILPTFRRLAASGSLPTEVRSAVMEAIYQISTRIPDIAFRT
jgi:HEAT repeat protein